MTGASPPAVSDFPEAKYDLDLYSDCAGTAATGRGVRLVGGRIVWTAGDENEDVPLGSIVSIQEYPAARINDIYPEMGRAMFLNGYQIGFGNGRSLTIVDSARSSWNVSGAQTGLFREFVAELHHRLTQEQHDSIRFLSGYNQRGKRKLRLFLAIIGMLLVVLPIVAFLLTGALRPLLLALFGGAMFWRFYKVADN